MFVCSVALLTVFAVFCVVFCPLVAYISLIICLFVYIVKNLTSACVMGVVCLVGCIVCQSEKVLSIIICQLCGWLFNCRFQA